MAVTVEVREKLIIVTKPGTDFAVTYEMREDADHIVMTQTWMPSHVASPTNSEFRTLAFQAAVDKARELGWIA
ncbi:MAG: hypothetical protein ACXW37_11390 [Nitrospira sp.]